MRTFLATMVAAALLAAAPSVQAADTDTSTARLPLVTCISQGDGGEQCWALGSSEPVEPPTAEWEDKIRHLGSKLGVAVDYEWETDRLLRTFILVAKKSCPTDVTH